MIELPAEHELISLFECEPALTDPDLPWLYNSLEFELTRGSERLKCVIDPGLDRVHLTWTSGSDELAELVVNDVRRIATEQLVERETLALSFAEDSSLGQVRVRTKPRIHVFWQSQGRIL